MVISVIMDTVGVLISTKMLFHFTPKTFFGAPRGEFTGKLVADRLIMKMRQNQYGGAHGAADMNLVDFKINNCQPYIVRELPNN